VGIIAAGLATAMTGGGVMVVPEMICHDPQPAVEKLLSERMPLQRLIIQVTMQPAGISTQMRNAIHSAILRTFEHRYHI
jgi:hypothetical protein